MHIFYDKFMEFMVKEEKDECVEFVLQMLAEGQLDIKTLYTEILEPSLNNIGLKNNEVNLCIWREHVRSSIVRTIIECCYPYVIKEKKKMLVIGKPHKKVVVLCPDGEYHDIGARMVSDFFTICGFESVFVGSSTPKDEFISVINSISPDYIAISVTNYYNLVSAKKTVDIIKNTCFRPIKIVVGGLAFINNQEAFIKMGADFLLKEYRDIEKLTKMEV